MLPAASLAAAPPDAISTARFGRAEVWLQPAPRSTARQLVVQLKPSAPARVVAVTVPPRNPHLAPQWASNLGLGTDRHGRLTAVLQGDHGLYWTHVTGSAALHRVPGSTGDYLYPSLFAGRVAYNLQPGDTRSVIRVGSLTSARARTVWSNRADPEWVAADTAIGARGRIAFVSVREGAGNGGFQAQVLQPNGKTKPLLYLGLGDVASGGLSLTATSADGRLVTVTRTLGDSSRDLTFSLLTGRRT